ncbi:PREDICTED: leukocyte cell-derived chemotaxin-2 [Elephantulus edwardii]|uniref:leukocyte cell-derived chemotaxin-2 n=1 Tax=Elephantulus edwardii TaxID=28737 RepID=UPI0003F0AB06|nr:PREDICTED: leukocyte cell-derived chemotaxin-2 [Elephantulus edwardii]
MFSTRLLFLAVLISTVMAGPWVNICASKSSNEIRTCDSHGCGQYTAQRNRGAHQGVDVLCPDGSTVYAPFTGTIVGQEKPYKNKNAVNNGVRISGRGFCIKMFYIKPIKYKGSIKKGEKLGTLLPLQKVYPGIQSHVHIENCDMSDPTKYL